MPLMTKGEIKLKEHHDRGSKHIMMTGGANNMWQMEQKTVNSHEDWHMGTLFH